LAHQLRNQLIGQSGTVSGNLSTGKNPLTRRGAGRTAVSEEASLRPNKRSSIMANTSQPINKKDEQRTSGSSQFGSDLKNRANEAGAMVADQARDVADRAREAASSAYDKAKQAASNLGHRAEDATSAVGSGMKSLAGTIKEKMPSEGMVGRASSAVADTLESGGRYLEEEGLSGMADDLTDLIRRNPIPALLLGIGLGFLIARSIRR
jgi:hypothetical protein